MLSERTAASIKPRVSLLVQGERQRLPGIKQVQREKEASKEASLQSTGPYRISLEKVK